MQAARSPQYRCFIGNLPYSADEALIAEYFAHACGCDLDPASVYLPLDRQTNAPLGYGFVTFPTEQAQLYALELDRRAQIRNRTLSVMPARDRPNPRFDRPAGQAK
jgi:RNA recognition motif-containing protein